MAQIETTGHISFKLHMLTPKVKISKHIFHFVNVTYITGFIDQSVVFHTFPLKSVMAILWSICTNGHVWLCQMVIFVKTYSHIVIIWPWPSFQGHRRHSKSELVKIKSRHKFFPVTRSISFCYNFVFLPYICKHALEQVILTSQKGHYSTLKKDR